MNEQQQQLTPQKPHWRFSKAKVPSVGVFVKSTTDHLKK